MKLEKREITLNEKDSLTDALFMQKMLLNECIIAMDKVTRRETKKALLQLIEKIGEDYFFIADLLQSLNAN